MNKNIDVIVAGGGAAGMMAAITCAANGKKVIIVEQKQQVGKKLLATGNGKCNFTNSYQEDTCYRSDNPSFPHYALSTFHAMDSIAFMEKIGVLSKERNGYYYPYSGQASTVLDALRYEMDRLCIQVEVGEKITAIKKEKEYFLAQYGDRTLYAKKVILAAGGKASPVHGSDGSGFILAKKFGHTVTKINPALTGLKASNIFCKALAGVRSEARISLLVDGIFFTEDTGEVQFVNYGVSGIPVFQVSRYAGRALMERKKVEISVDFFPGIKGRKLHKDLLERKNKFGDNKITEALNGLLNKKVMTVFLKECKIKENQRIKEISDVKLKLIATKMKQLVFSIEETNGFQNAQVCAGGIQTKEVNEKTMESKLVKNLYFAGEILDVDGMCGGYNLQWAWSSGYLAGMSAAR